MKTLERLKKEYKIKKFILAALCAPAKVHARLADKYNFLYLQASISEIEPEIERQRIKAMKRQDLAAAIIAKIEAFKQCNYPCKHQELPTEQNLSQFYMVSISPPIGGGGDLSNFGAIFDLPSIATRAVAINLARDFVANSGLSCRLFDDGKAIADILTGGSTGVKILHPVEN